MKKIYCDKCGKEIKPSELIKFDIDFKPFDLKAEPKLFDICPECAAKFSDWLKGNCPCQQKTVKAKEAKPQQTKKDKKTDKPATKPYTVAQIASVSAAPLSTIRRHMEGICSTYSKDKQGRTIRYYHLTDDQFDKLVERIKTRKQGSRTKI